jgi:chromosome partitioning protein
VLCIDIDQQGNLTNLLGIDGEEYKCMFDALTDPKISFSDLIISALPGIDLVPSNLDNALLENTLVIKKIRLDKVYEQRIKDVKDQYDLIVLDCPPALGANNAAAALASDLVVCVVDPDSNAIKGLLYSYQEITRLAEDNERTIPVKIVLNKFDKRTSLSHDTLEKLIKHEVFGPMLYKSYVGTNQQIPNASASLTSIFDSLKDSSAKVDIDLLTREILELDQALIRRNQERESKSNSAGEASDIISNSSTN